MLPAYVGGSPGERALAGSGRPLHLCAWLSQVAEVGEGAASPGEGWSRPGALVPEQAWPPGLWPQPPPPLAMASATTSPGS